MNYSNLNDVEFEYLCKDVMSRMLSKNLERFGPGRDGGIDLTDNSYFRNVIVQVKHYANTSVSGLMRSLEKEIPKVKEQSPKQYYVCCSNKLTVQNKAKVYEMFSDFMSSPDNIITALELDEFLESPENVDVLRKHFKLWLNASSILTDILTNDIFIDSEALLSNIEDEIKLFVKTKAFDEAIACLEKRNILIIIGNPGVGKTVTSKMLVLHYAAQDYRVRYITDGSDLKSLKRALAQSHDSREIILLDDCFGQAYFDMKGTQENELLALIKYVSLNPNKILIMNSRVSIYYEAKDRTPNLVKSFDRKEYRAYVLDIERMSREEKAKILYNHLYFYKVPHEYYESIRKNKAYRKIVDHKNYNPRVIEFICTPRHFKNVAPDQYASFVMKCLDNPEQIWKNEYERRLAYVDRIFLTTLYSLTNTVISFDMLKRCFEYRISQTAAVDYSVNHFEQVLNRLIDSMVKIVEIDGDRMISAANPSVNDFLRTHIFKNEPEKNSLITSSHSVRQLKRLLDRDSYETYVSTLFADHTILSFIFEDERQKCSFIAVWCALHQVCDNVYTAYIVEYIHNIESVLSYNSVPIRMSDILDGLFQKEFCDFYGLRKIIGDLSRLNDLFDGLALEDLVEVIKHIDWMFFGTERLLYISMIQSLLIDAIDGHCCDVPVYEYDIDVWEIIEECSGKNEMGWHTDIDEATDYLENIVADFVLDDLQEILSSLPSDINPNNELCLGVNVSVSGAESMIINYLREDYDDDEYHAYREEQIENDNVIDYIFNR